MTIGAGIAVCGIWGAVAYISNHDAFAAVMTAFFGLFATALVVMCNRNSDD